MRYFLVIFCLFAGLVPVSLAGAPNRIDAIRVWSSPDKIRTVFDVAAPVNYHVTVAPGSDRVILDLRGIAQSAIPKEPKDTDRFLEKIELKQTAINSWRIVFRLKQTVTVRSFLLTPNRRYGHRLVLDFFPVPAKHNSAKRKVVAKLSDRKKEGAATPKALRDVLVAVDAGHGGEDPGAVSASGTHEKKITLSVAKRLVGKLNAVPGIRAFLVRKGDYYIALARRREIAKKRHADIFVSLHADAFRDPSVRGSSIYVLSGSGASSAAAKWLADRENSSDLIGGVHLGDKDALLKTVLLDLSQTATIQASTSAAHQILARLKRVGKAHKKKVQYAGFEVLKSPSIPSVLIELAYLTNPREERRLLNGAYQQRLASGIAAGIGEYFKRYAPEGTLLAAKARAQKRVVAARRKKSDLH